MTTKHNRPAGANGGAVNQRSEQSQYTTNRRGLEVRRSDGRIVGQLEGDVLRKLARREHQLREPAAWAWDVAILAAAENAGARFTEIECDGLIYRASLSDFRRYGFPVSRGHGAQRGLPLVHWQIRCKGEPPAAVQMGLFEAAR